jgi:hypothetical protein
MSEEILNYTLTINVPIRTFTYTGLNMDEVVEIANEFGIYVPYDMLPTEPGTSVGDIDWQVEVPA